MKIVDLTHEAPTYCEVCGAELEMMDHEALARVGPGDLDKDWVRECGLVEGDALLVRWRGWWCPRDERHPDGPYLNGQQETLTIVYGARS